MSISTTDATTQVPTAEVTLAFTLAEEDLPILRHELELLMNALGPLAAWLEKRGGSVRIDGLTLP